MKVSWVQSGRRWVIASILVALGVVGSNGLLHPVLSLKSAGPTAHAASYHYSKEQYDTMMAQTWAAYKKYFVQSDGRVVDKYANSITTSEGQSYAMLRAAWMKDKDTFDQVYAWTVHNLQKRKDKLFCWKWGKEDKGQDWGVLDYTAASDADQDIALALLMGHRLWGEERYKTDAVAIIKDIWENDTVTTPIGRVLIPGDWDYRPEEKKIQLNPSYFAPYAYRVFAGYDPDHDWMDLVDTSYAILNNISTQTRTHLPTDWSMFSVANGESELFGWGDPMDKRSDYGYEAIRTHWRVALDYTVNPEEKRAKKWLDDTNWYLVRHWKIRNVMPGILTIDGIERDLAESPALYGTLLPALAVNGQQGITDVLMDRWVLGGLNRKSGLWEPRGDYYAQNWLWMGLVTYNYYMDKGLEPIKGPQGTVVLERLTFLLDSGGPATPPSQTP